MRTHAGPLVADGPVQADAGDLTRFVGLYSGRGSPVRIELRDGVLFAESDDAPTMRLVPLGEGRFAGTVLDLIDVRFAFERSGDTSRSETVRVTWGFREEEFTRADP